MVFDVLPEQPEAKRLLRHARLAAYGRGPRARLPPARAARATGKRRAAVRLRGAILGDEARVANGTHPDLYLLEPLGEMIRIDEIRGAAPRPAHAAVRGLSTAST